MVRAKCRTTWTDKLKYAHRHSDLWDRIAGLLVVVAFIAVGFDLFMRYRPLELVQIESPVLLDKEQYQVGEVVFGHFTGSVDTEEQPLVTRNLICDNNFYRLTDRTDTGGRRTLNDITVAITKLDETDLLQSGVIISPDTNCFIKFTNIYEIELPITGSRTERVSYFSDTFDIVP